MSEPKGGNKGTPGRVPTEREINLHVSQRIRARRILLGLSQADLAKAIGVTFQQANKYETAVNRINAGTLFQIAEALRVEVGYFFEGVAGGEVELEGEVSGSQSRLFLELSRSFAQINSSKAREVLLQAACNLAEAEGDDKEDEDQETR